MQTVIGVFDTVEEAQDAQQSLLNKGFDESEVRIQSQSTLKSFDAESSTTTSSRSGDSGSGSSSGEGFMASIGNFFSNLFGGDNEHAEHAGHYSEAVRRGGSVVVVTAQDESQVHAARTALSAAGAVDIDKRAAGWRQDGYSGFDPAAQPFGAKEVQADRSKMQAQTQAQTQPQTAIVQAKNNHILPIVQEEIEVGKREVDLGAVRVFSRTEMRPVTEQVQLREQHADIQRRPVDRPAAEADLKAFEGGSIEVKEMAERAIVSKTARVVEEVVVGTQATTRTETISDQVRSTVVDVEKTGEDNSLNQGTQGTPDYRSHYQANLANTGASYEDYEPAYRYGYGMRTDSRYANRAWNDVEGEAQRDWSSHNPNGNWEKFKLAVKHGWDSMTGSNTTSSTTSQRKTNTSV